MPADRPGVTPIGRVARHGSVYVLAAGIQATAIFLVVPALTRVLPAAEYGGVTIGLVVVQILGIAGALGLPTAAALAHVDDHAGGLGRSMIPLAAAAAGGVVLMVELVLLLAAAAGGGFTVDAGTRLALWAAVPSAVVLTSQAVLRVMEAPAAFSVVSISSTLFSLVLGLCTVWIGAPTEASFMAGYAAGLVVTAIVAVVLAVRTRPGPVAPTSEVSPVERQSLQGYLGVGLPTVPHGLAMYALVAVDRLIVERMDGAAAAGRYQLAYLLGAATLTILTAINGAWGPAVLLTPEPDRAAALVELTREIQRVVPGIVALVALAAPLGLAILAPVEYRPIELVPVTCIVVLCAPAFLDYLARVQVLFAWRSTGALAIATPIVAAFNLVAVVLLLDQFGLVGAAAAAVMSYELLALLVGRRARAMVAIAWDHRARAICWTLCAIGAALGAALPREGTAAVLTRAPIAAVVGGLVAGHGWRLLRAPD